MATYSLQSEFFNKLAALQMLVILDRTSMVDNASRCQHHRHLIFWTGY